MEQNDGFILCGRQQDGEGLMHKHRDEDQPHECREGLRGLMMLAAVGLVHCGRCAFFSAT